MKWSVDLAHPGYVSRIKQSPDKTDYTDARLLADLERVGYLPKVWLAPEEVRELRRLVRFRQQMVNERRNMKAGRFDALLRDDRVKQLAPFLHAWTSQCGWNALTNDKRMRSHPGWQSSWNMRASVLNDWRRLAHRLSRNSR